MGHTRKSINVEIRDENYNPKESMNETTRREI